MSTTRVRQPRATIRDIAARAGVSIATVSRVLNDRPDVAPETRESVLDAARALNFSLATRNGLAQKPGLSGLVGVTIPMVLGDYFSSIVTGIADALDELGFMAVLCPPTFHHHDREATFMHSLLERKIDGAVLVLPAESSDELAALKQRGFPFVVADEGYPLKGDFPRVIAANMAGAIAATEHLIALSHRRIGLVKGIPGFVATEDRASGYRAALTAAGIALDPDLEVCGDFDTIEGRVAAARLLDLPDPPTAVFACNDEMALAVLQEARARGIRVPQELSVVGFDDTTMARIAVPAITTIRQPLEEVGRMAVTLLTRIIDGQTVDPLRVEIGTRLVVRESTGPAPATGLRQVDARA
jgi:LacI family transcriptional regulator, galactose operon repressor